MKTIFRIFILMLLISVTLQTRAQNTQELIVPLSKSGETGTLVVNILTGSIKVVGTTVKDVNIRISSEQKKVEETSRNGLKRIQNNSFGLTANEENNVVKVSTDLNNKEVNLEIQVPQNFNLKLNAVNDGDITVQNVSGEIEISHVNGGIYLTNVSGSAVVNTTNGDVKASFVKVMENTPMSFRTFNGDVDVTFPAGLKASAKIKSDMGEIYTDFDMAMKKSTPKEEKKKEAGVYRVSIEDWVYGDINGGGPEMSFQNFQGDIILRKK
jgi:DUF4097 and DUF4098 domain-containing protein YvlB